MDETIKYLLALVIGALLTPLWAKFLNKNRSKLENNNLRSDECLKALSLFKESLKHVEDQNVKLKEQIKELTDKNDRTINYFNTKISELQEVNGYQTKKIMHLESEVKKCADGRKKASAKKKPVKKPVA